MESEFDEEQFSRFRQEGEESRQASEQFRQIYVRLKTYMEKQGVEFSDSCEGQYTDENGLNIRSFATLLSFEAIANENGQSISSTEPDYKKRLQAKCIARGLDEVWIKLIDKEFAGNPLTDDDTAIMAEVTLDVILQEEESKEWYNQKYSEMKSFLSNYGLDELSVREEFILSGLVTLKYRADKVGDQRRFLETARTILFKSELTSDPWFKLIEKFFT